MKNILHYYKHLFSQEFIDRTISGGLRGQISFLLAVIAGFLALAAIGVLFLDVQLAAEGDWLEELWVVYNNFVDPGNQFAQQPWFNRMAVAVISLFGSILLGGVLISTISNIIERRVEVIRTGKAYYSSIHDHVVIIGYSEVTISLIKELKKDQPDAIVLIMSGQETESLRHRLQAQLDKQEERGVYLYFGNVESLEDLSHLNIDRAKEVYILGEEGDRGRDSKNIQCVHRISMLKGETRAGSELPVYTQFDRIASFGIIQKLDNCRCFPANDPKGNPVGCNIYFRPFNIFENWARRLWSIYALEDEHPYDPLDYCPIRILPDGQLENGEKFVHLVIVGFCGMGQALLLEALRVCHYANYDDTQAEADRIRTQITVIDKDMDTLLPHFKLMFPHLDSQVDDLRIEYVNTDFCRFAAEGTLQAWCRDPRRMLTVAICISDPDTSISLGMNLPREVYQSDARVLIRQHIHSNLGEMIHRDQGRYRNVKVFGMAEDAMSRSMLRDELPSYVNQHYEDSIKDPLASYISLLHAYYVEGREMEYNLEATRAQVSWNNLGENYRWANRYQIEAYQTYLSTLGYGIARQIPADRQAVTPQQFKDRLTEKQLHALERMEKHRWNAERTIEGWKTGPIRCDVHRIHHLLVPYHMLPDDQKFKDCQVITQLPYLVELAGFQLYKIC